MNLNLDFGLYNIDLSKVIGFLKQDIKDDFFPDPLHYKDRFDQILITNYFEKNIDNNNGMYLPERRLLINVPKPQGTLRYSLETSFFDRLAYHAYGITIIQYFDKLLSRRVFNHRFNYKDYNSSRPRYLFYNPIRQWKKFEYFVKISGKQSTILLTDLANYFEHININILKKILLDFLRKSEVNGKEKARIRFCIESICSCLLKWSFNAEHGLPQNRDISSFLANIYLSPIDDIMINEGFDYYRYMDDIRIICKDYFQARKAIQILSVELRKIDLSLNGNKTKVLVYDTDEHKNFIHDEELELERIDALINTKKRNIVAIAYQEVMNKLEKCLNNSEYDSRSFRFLIDRISTIAKCKDIKKPKYYYRKIKKNILNAIVTHPAFMDKYYNFLSSIELTKTDLNKLFEYISNNDYSIYSWQNYAIWKLFILNNYKTRKLISLAIVHLKTYEETMIPGAVLYLGKFGNYSDKENILSLLKNTDSFFLQRHCLIALQEFPKNILQDTLNKIVESNKNVYEYFHGSKRHTYVKPPENVNFYDIFHQVGFYV
jgi:hypothetical protein